jgi:OmpA-OmpF porin, OOP family
MNMLKLQASAGAALFTLASVMAVGPAAASAQGATPAATLVPAPQRISDGAIQADHRAYEALQGRIKGLNDRGRPVRDYFLSKAQCWLDVSFHEYTRNDRSAFPQAAMTESEKLIVGMEQGVEPLPTDTPLVNDAARLRPDLWERAAALRGHAGWSCARQKAACAEVELVHAGNEFKQQQWRHAKPYVQIAEDLLGEAQALADSCTPPPPPAPAVPPPPSPPPAPPVLTPPVAPPAVPDLQLKAQVLFQFDRHEQRHALPASWRQLAALVQQIRREGLVVQEIALSGHADLLNSTRQGNYNLRLSERRVASVKAELVRLGIAPGLVGTAASGDAQQVQGCEAQRLSRAALTACLQPNRRVEVLVRARRP